MAGGDGVQGSEELRAALPSVGAMLGVRVSVDDGSEWRLDENGLTVGLGWYACRGHGAREAVALAALQLWEGPREAALASARALRRRALIAQRPELEPLVDAIARLQAMAELRAAMPGLREPLAAALQRSLPVDPSVLPRHLQWVALVLSAGSQAASTVMTTLDRQVLAEWRGLADIVAGRGSPEADPLQRVLVPNPRATPLRRLERALALLVPPYERLLAADAERRGLTTLGDGDGEGEGAFSEELSGMSESAGDAAEQAPEPDGQSGESPPEAAELFALERADFTRTVLSTPIPAEGALFDAALALEREDRSDAERSGAMRAAGAAGRAVAATSLAEYRARMERLAPAVERMRALWERVIEERVAQRRAPSRRPLPEGEELMPEALASAVAEVRAGVRRPEAFRRRVPRTRRTRGIGSTDYVLLIDRSASMSGRFAEAAADAMLVLVESLAGVERDIEHAEALHGIDLELDIRTALIVFDAVANVVKPLSHGIVDAVRRELHGSIRSPEGSTNDAAALRAAGEQLGVGRVGATVAGGLPRRRIVILVSDGGSNDPQAADRELRVLRAAGVDVHGIGVGSDEIAARYAPHGARIADARALPEALERIVESRLP